MANTSDSWIRAHYCDLATMKQLTGQSGTVLQIVTATPILKAKRLHLVLGGGGGGGGSSP